jgi:L,D-transpeptidase YcbB
MSNVIIKMITVIILCTNTLFAAAQITVEKVEQYLVEKKFIQKTDANRMAAILSFYSYNHLKTAWIQNENIDNKNNLFNILKQSANKGLREKDYQYDFIQSIKNNRAVLNNSNDSIEADVRITDAAIHFFSDIVYGNTKPVLSYNGIDETLTCLDISYYLSKSLEKQTINVLEENLSPSLKEIKVLEKKIAWINTVMEKDDFKEKVITSTTVSYSNEPLVSKLNQLGILNCNKNEKDTALVNRVKEAQKQFGLISDAIIRTTFLEEINVPLSKRLMQLNLALNNYRWLSCFCKQRATIVVNIPAAYLKVYKDTSILLEMRMVVGKKSTPTPTLLSTVNEVVLYPYWHVPYSIATKELLPRIKQDIGFIEVGSFQVLNSAGKIMQPSVINWRVLSTKYFPYTIRQSTGCDNALGLLKLNFYSPDGVYLHDTPSKNAFALNKRFFSHGCMRMEKPMELGHLVLKNNFIAIDTLEQKGCLRNQAPISVHADVHMPVLVWYNPVGIDSVGRVLFFEDVYEKFKNMQ